VPNRVDTAVVSDHLREELQGKLVKAAVFTTFGFESEFFEGDVIPLLLPGNIAFSSDDRVKEFQVREALRSEGIPLDVFYDLELFRAEGRTSPQMEYGCHGVRHAKGAFHAKLIFILAHDTERGEDCLLVGAGSNNLTRQGWWDNIECMHWEIVWSGSTPRRLLGELRADFAWLMERAPGAEPTATRRIAVFLRSCSYDEKQTAPDYLGLAASAGGVTFPRFLSMATRDWPYRNWSLEIVSPYFALNPEADEHRFFLEDLGVKEIHLFLPTNAEGEASVQPAYHAHIERDPNVQWASWAPAISAALGLSGRFHRRVHAKLYHFRNRRQSWVFVGSVNFSRQAMYRNIEAGFLVKLPHVTQLLKTLAEAPATFADPQEMPPGYRDETTESLPEIHLSYDWKSRSLTGLVERDEAVTVEIIGPEGAVVTSSWRLDNHRGEYTGDFTPLEELLKQGSLVRVRLEGDGGESWPLHRVLLQQTGWSHKPLAALPELTPEQILAIYADLSPERRQLLLMNAHVRKLIQLHQAGEMTVDDSDMASSRFFSEFAELFHAFRQLDTLLSTALETGNEDQVDYYLTGAGVDSLPALLEGTQNEASNTSASFTYLVLLCARELLKDARFKARPRVAERLDRIDQDLAALRSPGRLRLEDDTLDNRERFFTWFEKQFSRRYQPRPE
jgi:hypothetical protein